METQFTYQDTFSIVGMRLSSTSISVSGFPGETQVIAKTKLMNVGDVPLSGITITKLGLDTTLTNADVQFPTSLSSLQQVPINITLTATSSWSGKIGIVFNSAQVSFFFNIFFFFHSSYEIFVNYTFFFKICC